MVCMIAKQNRDVWSECALPSVQCKSRGSLVTCKIATSVLEMKWTIAGIPTSPENAQLIKRPWIIRVETSTCPIDDKGWAWQYSRLVSLYAARDECKDERTRSIGHAVRHIYDIDVWNNLRGFGSPTMSHYRKHRLPRRDIIPRCTHLVH